MDRSSSPCPSPSREPRPVRFAAAQALILTVGIWTVMAGAGVTADDIPPHGWKLTVGQAFRSEIQTNFRTELDLAGESRLTAGTDRVLLEYHVVRKSGSDQLLVTVKVVALQRILSTDDGEPETESLIADDEDELPVLDILVSADGRVSPVGTDDAPPTVLSGSQRSLNEMVDPDVLRSWIDMPFWVPLDADIAGVISGDPDSRPLPETVPDKDLTEGTSAAEKTITPETPADDVAVAESGPGPPQWHRPIKVSLGLLGSVTADATCRSVTQPETEPPDTEIRFSVSGALTHAAFRSDGESVVRFKEIQMTPAEISGEGRLRLDPLTGLPELAFVRQNLTFAGRAEAVSGNRTIPVTFTRTMTRACRVSAVQLRDTASGLTAPNRPQPLPRIQPR